MQGLRSKLLISFNESLGFVGGVTPGYVWPCAGKNH